MARRRGLGEEDGPAVIAIGTAGAALALASLSFVISLASLITTIVLWRRSGPRVRVTTGSAYLVFDGGVDTDTQYIAVEAANVGRAPVTISGWGIQLPGNAILANVDPAPWLPKLPYRLEAGASVTWHLDAATIRREAGARSVSLDVLRGFVQLATGEKVLARDPPPLS